MSYTNHSFGSLIRKSQSFKKMKLPKAFDDFTKDHMMPYQHKLRKEPLVLSCALYRQRESHKNWSLTNDHITINDTDQVLADDIRQHYNAKLTWMVLKGIELSKFRNDLNVFLNSSFYDDNEQVYTVPDELIGLIYKLPYFYEYDKNLDSVFDGKKDTIRVEDYPFLTTLGPYTLQMDFINKLTLGRTGPNYADEYWFRMYDKNNTRVMLPLLAHNPLVNLFEKVITNTITVTGHFAIRKKDDYMFMQPNRWTLQY